VTRGPSIAATRPGLVVHVEQFGLCWATSDPSDYLLPLVPEILSCRKETVSPARLLEMYCSIFSGGGHSTARVNLRVESMVNWDCLRASEGCGLAPDEHLVASLLIGESTCACAMVTDFTVEGSIPFYCGRRLYFKSKLLPSRASNTLRVVGMKGRENSYVPRDGLLHLAGPVPDDFALGLFAESLGEWCSFVAARRESSNGRPDRPCSAPVV